jgi:hypothetical protein
MKERAHILLSNFRHFGAHISGHSSLKFQGFLNTITITNAPSHGIPHIIILSSVPNNRDFSYNDQ